ncbi:MAG: DUF1573 domain-containing protein [Planctomycetes bacterium]|nr:DUF1573 domain-containing protein [Planctomycetota bacterium]
MTCRLTAAIASAAVFLSGCGGGTPYVANDAAIPLADDTSSETIEHNFGFVPADEQISTTIECKNTTGRAWNIRRVKSSCSCTVSKVPQSIVPPGGSIQVPVSYHAPHKSRDDVQFVNFFDEAMDRAVFAIKIKANVREKIVASPGSIEYGLLHPAAVCRRDLRIGYFGDQTIDGLEVVKRPEWLEITTGIDVRTGAEPVSTAENRSPIPRKSWCISTSTSLQSLPIGHASGEIVVRLKNSSVGINDEIAIPVSVAVGGDLTLSPQLVVLNPTEDGAFSGEAYLREISDEVLFEPEDSSLRVIDDPMNADILTTKWTRKSPRLWHLEVVCTPSALPNQSRVLNAVLCTGLTSPTDIPLRLKLMPGASHQK